MTPLQILAYAESIAPRVFLGAAEVTAAHWKRDRGPEYHIIIRVVRKGAVYTSKRDYTSATRDAYADGTEAFYENVIREIIDDLPEWRS